MTSDTTAARESLGGNGIGGEAKRKIPGEPGIWVFAILDMLIFAEMFGIFAWYRAENRDLYSASQQLVHPIFGLIYTLLLLTSSWLVVLALTAVRRDLYQQASKLVNWGFVCGAAFAALKLVEYGDKVSSGITPVTNSFFMFYFVLTFVHLLHASVGLGVLMFMRRRIVGMATDPVSDRSRVGILMTCAVYWHMVDLLWIVLFALFYLRG